MATACCKVGRVIDEYALRAPTTQEGGLDDYLADRWIGRGEFRPVGYRELADWLNKRLVENTYLDNHRSAIEARVENEYDLLSGDDSPQRDELIAELQSEGIDGEALASDLISRSTMARHLKDCLELEKGRRGSDSTSEWELDRIDYSRSTFRKNVVDAIKSLTNKGKLPGADSADIDLPVMLSCPDCGTRIPLSAALRRGSICPAHLGESDGEE